MITDERLEEARDIILHEGVTLTGSGKNWLHIVTKSFWDAARCLAENHRRAAPSEEVQRAISSMTYKNVKPKSRPTTICWLTDEERQLAITALRQMQGWIPVSEGLPRQCEHILVFGAGMGVEVALYVVAPSVGWSGFRVHGNGANSAVTHWMPLPDGPKGE